MTLLQLPDMRLRDADSIRHGLQRDLCILSEIKKAFAKAHGGGTPSDLADASIRQD